MYNTAGHMLPGAFSLVQLETSEPIACPSFPVRLPWKQEKKWGTQGIDVCFLRVKGLVESSGTVIVCSIFFLQNKISRKEGKAIPRGEINNRQSGPVHADDEQYNTFLYLTKETALLNIYMYSKYLTISKS